MDCLLRALVRYSEKAASIARALRKEDGVFHHLVEEKAEHEKNKKFSKDMKTLADVLIQEGFKHDIGLEFPTLKDSVYGEESGKFSMHDGSETVVEMCATVQETEAMLTNILGEDRRRVARLLATEAHSEAALTWSHHEEATCCELREMRVDFNHLGVWIDPIDATNEYVEGQDSEPCSGIYSRGLHCVTVLIGVFDKTTSLPIIGVVNQPFWEKDESGEWHGRYFWGVCHGDYRRTGSSTGLSDTSEDDCASCIIVTSPGEVPDITDKLSKSGDLHLIRVSGAGYKFLCVIEGLAACSINSRSCTYAWDTCGPHGVLRSMGGGAISYKDAMQSDNCDSMAQLSYRPKSPEYAKHVHCHGNGLITYKSVTALETVLRTLKS